MSRGFKSFSTPDTRTSIGWKTVPSKAIIGSIDAEQLGTCFGTRDGLHEGTSVGTAVGDRVNAGLNVGAVIGRSDIVGLALSTKELPLGQPSVTG
jgi:hypothetical protein